MKVEAPRLNLELLKRFFHIPAPRPNRVQIEITNRCNLDCPMCPRNDYRLPPEDMDFELFKRIMSRLRDIDLILPIGWGESFMHSDIIRIILYLKQHSHQIKITTNGLLLGNPELMEAALKIDYLTFSIDELNDNGIYGHGLRVINNIKDLVKRKSDRGQKIPFIGVQSVLYRGNQDILKIIRLASELRVDRVNIMRTYSKFNKGISLPWEKRKEIYKNAERLGKKLGIRVDMFEYVSFYGVKRILWKYGKSIFRINKWCPRLYDFAYVTLDGKVTPCCALPRYIVGDLTVQTIDEIWRSEKMQEFRRNHPAICIDCEVLKVE